MSESNIKFTADEKELLRAQARLIEQQEKQIQKYQQTHREAQKAGKGIISDARKVDRAFKDGLRTQDKYRHGFQAMESSSKSTFGSMQSSILSAAMGFGSMATAVGVVSAAMADMRQQTEDSKLAVEQLIESRRRLLQVARGGEDNQAMNDLADSLARRGITREAGRQIAFSARSEGYEGSEDLVARLVAANVLTTESATRAAGQIRGIYDGKISPVQGIVGVKNAAEASRLDVDQFMEELPKLASAASEIGSSPAETNAILSVIATKSSEAGKYAATLANRFAVMPEFADKPGVMGLVDRLQAMPESERREYLGTDKAVNLAYSWLTKGESEIRKRTSANQAAMDDASGFVSRMEEIAYDPKTQTGRLNLARRNNVVAQVNQEISRETRLAEGGFDREAFVTSRVTQAEESGIGPVAGYVRRQAMEYAAASNAPKPLIDAAGFVGERAVSGGGLIPVRELTNAFMSFIRGIDAAGERFQDRVSGGAEAAGNQTNAARARQAGAGGATEAR